MGSEESFDIQDSCLDKRTEIERVNAKADFGILAIKPNGVGLSNAGQWWAVLPMEAMVRLLREAGYGDPL